MNNFYNSTAVMPSARQNPYLNNMISPNISASTNNIIWVQGIEGAKAWQLNPNSRAILLDSEVEGKMYIKICDEIGISTLRIFNYKEEEQSNNVNKEIPLDLSQYVKKDELAQMIKEIMNEPLIPTTDTTVSKTSSNSTASGF